MNSCQMLNTENMTTLSRAEKLAISDGITRKKNESQRILQKKANFEEQDEQVTATGKSLGEEEGRD